MFEDGDKGKVVFMTEENLQKCVICGQNHHEGVRLFHAFICDPCEQEIVQTDVHEERYRFFIRRMRSVWLKKDA